MSCIHLCSCCRCSLVSNKVDEYGGSSFGILYYPFEFFIDILTRLLNLNIPDNPSITFPGVSIMGIPYGMILQR